MTGRIVTGIGAIVEVAAQRRHICIICDQALTGTLKDRGTNGMGERSVGVSGVVRVTLVASRDDRSIEVSIVCPCDCCSTGVVGAVRSSFIVMAGITRQGVGNIPDFAAIGEVTSVGTGAFAAIPLDEAAGVGGDPGVIQGHIAVTVGVSQCVQEATSRCGVAWGTVGTVVNKISREVNPVLGMRLGGTSGAGPAQVTFTAGRDDSITNRLNNIPTGVGEVVGTRSMTGRAIAGTIDIAGLAVDLDITITMGRSVARCRVPVSSVEGKGIAGTFDIMAILTEVIGRLYSVFGPHAGRILVGSTGIETRVGHTVTTVAGEILIFVIVSGIGPDVLPVITVRDMTAGIGAGAFIIGGLGVEATVETHLHKLIVTTGEAAIGVGTQKCWVAVTGLAGQGDVMANFRYEWSHVVQTRSRVVEGIGRIGVTIGTVITGCAVVPVGGAAGVTTETVVGTGRAGIEPTIVGVAGAATTEINSGFIWLGIAHIGNIGGIVYAAVRRTDMRQRARSLRIGLVTSTARLAGSYRVCGVTDIGRCITMTGVTAEAVGITPGAVAARS